VVVVVVVVVAAAASLIDIHLTFFATGVGKMPNNLPRWHENLKTNTQHSMSNVC
jgi:polysaccharide pyruvyl transferase WcaK-like protein